MNGMISFPGCDDHSVAQMMLTDPVSLTGEEMIGDILAFEACWDRTTTGAISNVYVERCFRPDWYRFTVNLTKFIK